MIRTRHALTHEPPLRPAAARPAVELRAVSKVHGNGPGAVRALDHVTLGFTTGTFTAVMGPSGSGKSTLLHCAAGLDRPTSGSVLVEGRNLTELDETGLTRLRRDRMGFVFQAFNLLPTLTVRQNVTLPAELAGRRAKPADVRAVLDLLGLGDRLDHLPAQLSGGQQQRAAIARAVLANPAVVFADEPTGSLDTTAAREVLTLLRRMVSELGRTIVMVTHDPVAASYADGVVFLADGRVVDTMSRPSPGAVAGRMARLGEELR
jgi:putative ABC transport system ATP-binding protein